MTIPISTEVRAPSDSANLSHLGHWLEEYGEIAAILPVLTGLLVTSRLQLRGVNALAMNIVMAAMTRQIIIHLKQEIKDASPNGPCASNTAAISDATTESEDYTIVHSTPGRIRLRIPRLQHDAIYASQLEELLLTEDIVLGVRMSRAASSLVLHYDSTDLTDLDLGMRLMRALEQTEQSVMNL